MPNNDYILRSDALKAIRYENWREENRTPSIEELHLTEYQLLAEAINNIPAADVEPVRHGRWIMYAYDEAICSECGYDRGTEFESTKEAKERWDELPMWCEGCGAKMDREEGRE